VTGGVAKNRYILILRARPTVSGPCICLCISARGLKKKRGWEDSKKAGTSSYRGCCSKSLAGQAYKIP
jgi:hypothetical protein